MNNEHTLIPCYKLSADHLTLYESLDNWFSDAQAKTRFENLSNNVNEYWELSEGSRKRLKEKLTLFVFVSKNKKIRGNIFFRNTNKMNIEKKIKLEHKKSIYYKLIMITLTLPFAQFHSDNEIKSKLLNHFLTIMRQKKYFVDYIWKAEKQDNGNIHFHILTNKFVKWQVIRAIWNKILSKKKFNYIKKFSDKQKEFFKNGFKTFPGDIRNYKTQYNAYLRNKKENWQNPNSTDVVAMKNSKFLINYLVKYIAKGVTKTKRKQQLIKLFTEKKDLEKYTKDKASFYLHDTDIRKAFDRLNLVNKEIDILKKKGVQGFIWNTSSTISKFNPLSDIEYSFNIPDFDLVKKIKHFETSFFIGTREIKTYYFDINKTHNLKKKLENHLINIS